MPGSVTPLTSGAACARIAAAPRISLMSTSRLARSPKSMPTAARRCGMKMSRGRAILRLRACAGAPIQCCGRRRDERRIRAILQKPAHQISQQVAVAADRRIDAAGNIRKFGEQCLIKRFAHAVEPLEFEAVDSAGILDNAGYGQRIVRGE